MCFEGKTVLLKVNIKAVGYLIVEMLSENHVQSKVMTFISGELVICTSLWFSTVILFIWSEKTNREAYNLNCILLIESMDNSRHVQTR